MQLSLNLNSTEQVIRVHKSDVVQWESKNSGELVQAVVVDLLEHDSEVLRINILDSPNNGIVHVIGKLAAKNFKVVESQQNTEFKQFTLF